MSTSDIVKEVRKRLTENIDSKTQAQAQRFFKEKIEFYGVRVVVVKQIAKDLFKIIKNEDKSSIFSWCEELWKSGYTEESYIANEWSYAIHKQYTPDDFKTFERWLNKYVNNWSSCDPLCNHTIGEFIEMYPSFLSRLKVWTTSKNRWMRRGAAVTLIIPAKKGLFLKDIFEIADILLLDQDDLVQKGYGWMLKVASQARQKEVFDYIMKNKNVMPRTALRYAIEKMPENLKKKAMEK